VTNYYAVTFASAFGDDPNPAVNKLAKAVKAGTGGFVTGAAAIDGLVTAYARAGNTTNGAALAAQLVKFHKVPTISGLVSFSATQHTVYGRKYRVISITGTKEKVIGSVVAKVIPKV
jgi:branched-chain amino acid transport system substrate-binding protein